MKQECDLFKPCAYQPQDSQLPHTLLSRDSVVFPLFFFPPHISTVISPLLVMYFLQGGRKALYIWIPQKRPTGIQLLATLSFPKTSLLNVYYPEFPWGDSVNNSLLGGLLYRFPTMCFWLTFFLEESLLLVRSCDTRYFEYSSHFLWGLVTVWTWMSNPVSMAQFSLSQN